MNKGLLIFLAVALFGSGAVPAAEPKEDVFRGKLFPPNIILENQAELDLTKDQFTAIKKAVVEVQSNIAEHEWDVREAYGSIMRALDAVPINEDQVLEYVGMALSAENEVKKEQVMMLIKLKNLLTAEQVAYLESVRE